MSLLLAAGSSGAYTLTCQTGIYSLSGNATTLLKSKFLTANVGTYSISGQNATLAKSKYLPCNFGAYSLNGQDATLTKTSAGNYVLTCQTGNYSLTGGNATLTYGGQQNVSGGGWSFPSRKKRLSRKEEIQEEPQYLSERDAEIRALILAKLEPSKKTAKSIKAERSLRLPVLEIANEIQKTQNKLQQITEPAITSQQMEMLLALMMEMM